MPTTRNKCDVYCGLVIKPLPFSSASFCIYCYIAPPSEHIAALYLLVVNSLQTTFGKSRYNTTTIWQLICTSIKVPFLSVCFLSYKIRKQCTHHNRTIGNSWKTSHEKTNILECKRFVNVCSCTYNHTTWIKGFFNVYSYSEEWSSSSYATRGGNYELFCLWRQKLFRFLSD